MNDSEHITSADRALNDRFTAAVLAGSDAYPDGTAFVASDTPGLSQIISRNMREQRATAIVHDDGSEVLLQPPHAAGLWLGLILASVLLLTKDRARPKVEAGGEVIELPVGSRIRLRAPADIAA
jgi:hypothetical protein